MAGGSVATGSVNGYGHRDDGDDDSTHLTWAARAWSGLLATLYELQKCSGAGDSLPLIVLLWLVQLIQLLTFAIPPTPASPYWGPAGGALWPWLLPLSMVPRVDAGLPGFGHDWAGLFAGVACVVALYLGLFAYRVVQHARAAVAPGQASVAGVEGAAGGSHTTSAASGYYLPSWMVTALKYTWVILHHSLLPAFVAVLASAFACPGGSTYMGAGTIPCFGGDSMALPLMVAAAALLIPSLVALDVLISLTAGVQRVFDPAGKRHVLAAPHGRIDAAVSVLKCALAVAMMFGAVGMLSGWALAAIPSVAGALWFAAIVHYQPHFAPLINGLLACQAGTFCAAALGGLVGMVLGGGPSAGVAPAVAFICVSPVAAYAGWAYSAQRLRSVGQGSGASAEGGLLTDLSSVYDVQLRANYLFLQGYRAGDDPRPAKLRGEGRGRASSTVVAGGSSTYAQLPQGDAAVAVDGGSQDEEGSEGGNGPAPISATRAALDKLWLSAAAQLGSTPLLLALSAQHQAFVDGNTQLERLYLRNAATAAEGSWANLDVTVWVQLRRRAIAEEEVNCGKGAMNADLRLIFEATLELARSETVGTRDLVLQFFTELTQKHPNLPRLQKLGMAISGAMATTDATYRHLLSMAPSNAGIMRMYADFLLELANNPRHGLELLADAEAIEEEASRVHLLRDDFTMNAAVTDFDIAGESVCMVRVSNDPATLGTITAANAAALRFFGYARRELLGKNVDSLIPQPISGVHQQYLLNFLNTGKESILKSSRSVLAVVRSGYLVPALINIRAGDADFAAVIDAAPAFRGLGFILFYGQSGEAHDAGYRVTGICEASGSLLDCTPASVTSGAVHMAPFLASPELVRQHQAHMREEREASSARGSSEKKRRPGDAAAAAAADLAAAEAAAATDVLRALETKGGHGLLTVYGCAAGQGDSGDTTVTLSVRLQSMRLPLMAAPLHVLTWKRATPADRQRRASALSSAGAAAAELNNAGCEDADGSANSDSPVSSLSGSSTGSSDSRSPKRKPPPGHPDIQLGAPGFGGAADIAMCPFAGAPGGPAQPSAAPSATGRPPRSSPARVVPVQPGPHSAAPVAAPGSVSSPASSATRRFSDSGTGGAVRPGALKGTRSALAAAAQAVAAQHPTVPAQSASSLPGTVLASESGVELTLVQQARAAGAASNGPRLGSASSSFSGSGIMTATTTLEDCITGVLFGDEPASLHASQEAHGQGALLAVHAGSSAAGMAPPAPSPARRRSVQLMLPVDHRLADGDAAEPQLLGSSAREGNSRGGESAVSSRRNSDAPLLRSNAAAAAWGEDAGQSKGTWAAAEAAEVPRKARRLSFQEPSRKEEDDDEPPKAGKRKPNGSPTVQAPDHAPEQGAVAGQGSPQHVSHSGRRLYDGPASPGGTPSAKERLKALKRQTSSDHDHDRDRNSEASDDKDGSGAGGGRPGSVRSGGSRGSGSQRSGSMMSVGQIVRAAVSSRGSRLERSLSLLHRALLVAFVMVACLSIASLVLTEVLLGQLSDNLNLVELNGVRVVKAVRNFAGLVNLALSASGVGQPINMTAFKLDAEGYLGDLERTHRQLYLAVDGSVPEEKWLYTDPTAITVFELTPGSVLARDIYNATPRGVSLTNMGVELVTRTRKVIQAAMPTSGDPSALTVPRAAAFNTSSDMGFILASITPMRNAFNESTMLADQRSATQASVISLADTVFLAAAETVFLVIGCCVLLPAVSKVLGVKQAVFDTLLEIPLPVVRQLRSTVQHKVIAVARAEEEGDSVVTPDKAVLTGDGALALHTGTGDEFANAGDVSDEGLQANGSDDERGLRAALDTSLAKVRAAQAEVDRQVAAAENASGCCAAWRAQRVAARGALAVRAAARNGRRFRGNGTSAGWLLMKLCIPLLAYGAFFAGWWAYQQSVLATAVQERAAVLWAQQAQMYMRMQGRRTQDASAYCEPPYVREAVTVGLANLAFLEHIQDSLLLGNAASNLVSGLQTSPATNALFMIDGCVPGSKFYTLAECRAFANGVFSQGLLAGMKDMAVLTRAIMAERLPKADCARGDASCCQPMDLVDGIVPMVLAYAFKYLPAGLEQAATIRVNEAQATLSSFLSNSILATVLSILALLLFYLFLYRPQILALNKDIARVRGLLLLFPDSVSRTVPSLVAVGRDIAKEMGGGGGGGSSGSSVGSGGGR